LQILLLSFAIIITVIIERIYMRDKTRTDRTKYISCI